MCWKRYYTGAGYHTFAIKNESHVLSIEAIVANEIRKQQVDNGLRLETDGYYNCPLKWWSLNHGNYPTIWKLAECILAIPATSAPAEQVFSSAANIVNKKRVALKPENVDLLVFMRGNKLLVNWEPAKKNKSLQSVIK